MPSIAPLRNLNENEVAQQSPPQIAIVQSPLLMRRLSTASTQIMNLRNENMFLMSETDRLSRNVAQAPAELEQRLSAMENDMKTMAKDLKETKEKLENTEDELKETKDELKETKDELKETKDELKKTKESMSRQFDGLSRRFHRIENVVEQELTSLRDEISQLRPKKLNKSLGYENRGLAWTLRTNVSADIDQGTSRRERQKTLQLTMADYRRAAIFLA